MRLAVLAAEGAADESSSITIDQFRRIEMFKN